MALSTQLFHKPFSQRLRCSAITARQTRCTHYGNNVNYHPILGKFYRVCNQHHATCTIGKPGSTNEYSYTLHPRRGYWPGSGTTEVKVPLNPPRKA